MITLRENLYINTFLGKEGRGIWCKDCFGYMVCIRRKGKYNLEFKNEEKAKSFLEKIFVDGKDSVLINGNIITINKIDNEQDASIGCVNEEFANKLVKNLRKQWILIRKNLKKDKIADIENTGLKF